MKFTSTTTASIVSIAFFTASFATVKSSAINPSSLKSLRGGLVGRSDKGHHHYDEQRRDMKNMEYRHQLAPDSRIVGGEQSEPGDYPYYVGMGGCGGALIAPSVVLFAAHCRDYKDQQVNVGSYKKWSDKFGAQQRFCDVWIGNPNYDGPSGINNDFALCQLNEPVDISESKVKLILNEEESIPSVNEDLLVCGLGALSQGGGGPGFLYNVTVPTISTEQCNANGWYNGRITDQMLCAGFTDGGKDSCQGDSGGPIVRRKYVGDGRFEDTHVGVVSWGEGCALPKKPGVYARTSSGSGWIKEVVCGDWSLPADFCGDDPANNDNIVDPINDDEECNQKLDIIVNTDTYGIETGIALTEQSGLLILRRKYLLQFYTNTHTVCLKSNTCYNFEVTDSYGDGMCTNQGALCGSFELKLNGETKLLNQNPNFGSRTSFEVCTDESDNDDNDNDNDSQVPTAAPVDDNTNAPTTAPFDDTEAPFAAPSVESEAPFSNTDEPFEESFAPFQIVTFEPVVDPLVPISTDCEEGFSKFQVQILTDNYGGETYWDLTYSDTPDSIIAGSNTSYPEPNTDYTDPSVDEYFCLEPGDYTFTMADKYGDGVCCQFGEGHIIGILNNIEIFAGGNFTYEDTRNFTVTVSDDDFDDETTPTRFPTFNPTSEDDDEDDNDNDDILTGRPTVYPTFFPTGYPTDSNMPSDGPSISPSNRPSNAPSDSPTKSPTLFPTFEPTDFPSEEPTGAPSQSPTISCIDSTGIVWTKNKTCKFATKGNKKKIAKKCNRKYKGVFVKDACPKTCGKKAGVGKCAFLFGTKNKTKKNKNNKNKNKNKI